MGSYKKYRNRYLLKDLDTHFTGGGVSTLRDLDELVNRLLGRGVAKVDEFSIREADRMVQGYQKDPVEFIMGSF